MVISRRSDSAEQSQSTPLLQSMPMAEFETQPINTIPHTNQTDWKQRSSYWNSGMRKFEVMERCTNVAACKFSCRTTAHLHRALL